jgi:hypothetical protein
LVVHYVYDLKNTISTTDYQSFSIVKTVASIILVSTFMASIYSIVERNGFWFGYRFHQKYN